MHGLWRWGKSVVCGVLFGHMACVSPPLTSTRTALLRKAPVAAVSVPVASQAAPVLPATPPPPPWVELDDLFTACPHSVRKTVRFLDFGGRIRQVSLSLPAPQAPAFIRLFDKLVAARFPLAALREAPEAHLSEALSSNRSFVTCSREGEPLLVVNPVQNPLLLGHHGEPLQEQARVYPAAGLLNVGRTHQRQGLLTHERLALFRSAGFQLLPSSEDRAFFGVFSRSEGFIPPTVPPMGKQPHAVISLGPLTEEDQAVLLATDKWRSGCPVPLARLAKVSLASPQFVSGTGKEGLVVLDLLAPMVASALEEMLQKGLQIDASQTSSFYCRAVRGQSALSLHSYGTAIDFNATVNPFLGMYTVDSTGSFATGGVLPPTALAFFVRNVSSSLDRAEDFRALLAKQGFSWGGAWTIPIDTMHFELSRFVSNLLAGMSREDGARFLTLSLRYPVARSWSNTAVWMMLYTLYGSRLLDVLEAKPSGFWSGPESAALDALVGDMSIGQ